MERLHLRLYCGDVCRPQLRRQQGGEHTQKLESGSKRLRASEDHEAIVQEAIQHAPSEWKPKQLFGLWDLLNPCRRVLFQCFRVSKQYVEIKAECCFTVSKKLS